MANTTGDLLAGDSTLESILATSLKRRVATYREPILPIAEGQSPNWRSIWAAAKTPSVSNRTISTRGVSGNARVVNIAGDCITHNNDGLGPETLAILESMDQRLKVVHDAVLDEKVGDWLSAPDVSQNLNAAIRKRQAGTGDWFLDGTEFAEWKENSKLLLCIYGTPGCGKTVLCSAIIEAVKDLCKTRPMSGWAYFFFDSRNANKDLQLYDKFLRSVLSQLSSRSGGTHEAVKKMYEAHGSGKEQPSVKALEATLRQVIVGFDDVYIMVDSLDESADRNELLKWIETLARWNSARWHLLTTSRLEPDITSHLEVFHNIRIVRLQGKTLDQDISVFLNERLSLTRRWKEPIRALITTTLIEGADGMFRWVAMQIDSLEDCLKDREVKEKLKDLPKDLQETYERILANSARRDDLLQMLHWLAFSARALRVEELAEVLSVDFDAEDGPCYDSDLKYSDPSMTLTVCSGLVTVTGGLVKLAHVSVKEYLISDHIKTGPAAHFAINQRLSHSVITETCAAYLLIFNQSGSLQLPGGTSGRFPLHLYAAQNLPEHLRLMENNDCPALQELLLKLFIPTPPYESALDNWVLTHDFDSNYWGDGKVTPPIYYASFLGLRNVVECLIKNDHDVDREGGWYGSALIAAAANAHTETAKLLLESGAHVNNHGILGQTALMVAADRGHINIAEILFEHRADIEFRDLDLDSDDKWAATALELAVENGDTEMVRLLLGRGADPNLQVERYGTTLQAAAYGGHTGTVKILLEHGVDVNMQGGWYGTALQAAAEAGHAEVVKMLLEHGADANMQGGEYGTALHSAAQNGHAEVVKMLLEQDVNILGGRYGNALQAAAAKGHTGIIKMLLEHGTDINIQGGHCGTALQGAASEGHTEVVKLLLEDGADVNILGGWYGTALQAAAVAGLTETVKVLLEQGADANIQGGNYGTALQAATFGGNTEVVKMFLERSEDVNIQGGWYGNASQAAAYRGHTGIIKILLERGADINIQGGWYGTALQAAASEGRVEVVKMLLKDGADINIQGGHCGTALQGAASKGHTAIVKMLLEDGADVNIQGGEYGTAMQAAACTGHAGIIKMLLEHGADINIQGGEYGTALQAAAYREHANVVKMLLEHGAHVNIQGGEYGTALQAAAAEGHTGITKMLLKHGADVNILGGYYGTALQAAAYHDHAKVVKMLLKNGAHINVQGGQYGNALQAAVCTCNTEVVTMLLERGADVNIRAGEYGTALQEAAHQSNTEVVKILLDHGADVNIQGGRYGNALQAAVTQCNAEVVRMLLEHGADDNIQAGSA